MFEFNKEFLRIFKSKHDVGIDPSVFELLGLENLTTQARAFDTESGRASSKERFKPALEAARLWIEIARRSGDPAALKKATQAAEYAGRYASSVKKATLAALTQAEACLLTLELYHSAQLIGVTRDLLKTCTLPAQKDETLSCLYALCDARLATQEARLKGFDDLDPALEAMALIDKAVNLSDSALKKIITPSRKHTNALARFERADLLLDIAQNRSDQTIPQAIITEFEALRAKFDAYSEPVTVSHIVARLARAYGLLGRITKNADLIKQALFLLTLEESYHPEDHSLLDLVAHQVLMATILGWHFEVTQEADGLKKALTIIDFAVLKNIAPNLKLFYEAHFIRLSLKTDAAQPDASPDWGLIDQQLKNEMKTIDPRHSAILWALYQLSLGKVYVLRSLRHGLSFDRLEANYALMAAHDIFEEKGLVGYEADARQWLLRVQVDFGE